VKDDYYLVSSSASPKLKKAVRKVNQKGGIRGLQREAGIVVLIIVLCLFVLSIFWWATGLVGTGLFIWGLYEYYNPIMHLSQITHITTTRNEDIARLDADWLQYIDGLAGAERSSEDHARFVTLRNLALSSDEAEVTRGVGEQRQRLDTLAATRKGKG
jgi:hypothetical protein